VYSLNSKNRERLLRGEETLTDNLLYHTRIECPGNVQVFQFNKKEERHTGADWEWWITDIHGESWLGLRIQAKRIAFKGDSCSYSALVNGRGVKQVENLIEDSGRNKVPLCFFYNYFPCDDVRGNRCGTCGCDLIVSPQRPCSQGFHGCPQYGCTMVHAKRLNLQRPYTTNMNVRQISRISLPLACLVCKAPINQGGGDGCPQSPNDTLPFHVQRVLQQLTRVGGHEKPEQKPEHIEIPDPTKNPPDYVRLLYDGKINHSVEEKIPPVRAVVIIKQGK